jgi:hypothetical protein
MAGGCPSEKDFTNLLRPAQVLHDIYVLSSQEAANTSLNSVFVPSKHKIIEKLRKVLGQQYFLVHSVSL